MPTYCRQILLLLACACVAENSSRADDEGSPSFRHEVMAVLSKAGCNQGTCHGNAHGKGGLKLSLRGQDPKHDFDVLTRQTAARHVTPLDPDHSLLLQKPSMQIPHEGGRRFSIDSREFQILRRWIASGLLKDADSAPTLVELKVNPSHATVAAPERTVAMQATATFSDGSSRNVTELAVMESSATFVSVSEAGRVSSDQPGLTTVTVRYLNQQVPVRLEFVSASPEFVFAAPTPQNVVDAAVFAQLQRLKLQPASMCSDNTFVRRAYLDLVGLLPSAARAQEFVKSEQPDKRAALIDELLASDEFNDMQALRWADLLRVDEKTLDSKGVDVFYDWIRTSFVDRKPLNLFAAELIAARGSTYEIPPTNFYRALRNPEQRAEATAQVFLGIRLQCAKCHNHPFDRWTQDDYYSWSNFFARVDYKIIDNKRRDKNDKNEFVGEQIVNMKDSGEVKNPDTGQTAGLRFLGAGHDDDEGQLLEKLAEFPYLKQIIPDRNDDESAAPDRLQRLAIWLSDPSNDRFAITQSNRIWAQLMGRGVIDPVDDFRSTNPPTNPELLEALQNEFVGSGFDVRHLMRLIMNSNTYQLASSDDQHMGDEWDGCFAWTNVRRLTAEQTLDGICQVVGVPAEFGGHSLGTKAVQLKGVRNGGHRHSPPEIGDRFLKLFGKPNRLQTCECERSNETTLAQTFEMVSGDLISELMTRRGNRFQKSIEAGLSDQDILSEFYWAALSRDPEPEELAIAAGHITKQKDRRQGLEDVLWALLNCNEFLLRK